MANFDALFAGCESFMEGDVEINNDVTVPASEGDALEAESVAEDVGTEGGEIAGEAETEDTKAEAANMVFDQLLNMYRHVRRYGVDRTFLSLYNGNGQLNRMVGYRFPSCESIDSVGSPRSQASRAFLIAMESDGIFDKIWTWIKETAVKVYNFFIKVMDWFREACGNLDMRVGKLLKYFDQNTPKNWGDIRNKSVKYFEKNRITDYATKANKAGNELMQIAHDNNLGTPSGNTLAEQIADASTKMHEAFERASTRIKSRSQATDASKNVKWKTNDEYIDENGNKQTVGASGSKINNDDLRYGSEYYGRTKDKDDKDGVKALKDYIDRINKDLVDPLADAVSEISMESDDIEKITDDNKANEIVVKLGNGGIVSFTKIGHITVPDKQDDQPANDVQTVMKSMLTGCKDVLVGLLKQKHAMQMMELANKQFRQTAEQTSRLAGNGSGDYEAHKDAKLAAMGMVKSNSVFARITTLNEKIIAKCCSLAASYQGCMKAKTSS